MAENLLDLVGVHYAVPTGEKVLDGLDLSLERGQGLVVVALSGGGKTTVLRVAAGLVSAQTGSVRLEGRVLSDLSFAEYQEFLRHTGFVFQNSALLINLRAFDNVALPLRYHCPEIGEAEIARRVEASLRDFGVWNRAQEFPATLSVSDRRLVNFARALVLDPRLLLLDEPFVGVPPAQCRKIAAILRRLKQERGLSLLVAAESVSHLIDSGMVDRIAVLKRGRIVRRGSVEEFLGSRTPRVMNGQPATRVEGPGADTAAVSEVPAVGAAPAEGRPGPIPLHERSLDEALHEEGPVGDQAKEGVRP